jgi:hypothetical protein
VLAFYLGATWADRAVADGEPTEFAANGGGLSPSR